MSLVLAGLSHRSAPLAVLERVAYRPPELAAALSRLLGVEGVIEAALLSTCNRTEVYAVVAPGVPAEYVGRFLVLDRGLPWGGLRPYLFVRDGEDAAQHLFEVAGGLDSMVVGEAEILGQVRAACEIALKTGAAGSQLASLFARAVAAGRRIRRQTPLGTVRRSLGRTAVAVAAAERGGLAASVVLVVGAGKVARSVVDGVLESQVGRLIVSGRTEERAVRLAGSRAEVFPFGQLEAGMAEADVVICCTGASQRLIEADDLERVMRHRPDNELLVIDLSVPRAVQPEAGSVSGVRLYDLQRLGADAIQDAGQLMAAVERGREIAHVEARRFSARLADRLAASLAAAT